MIDITDVAHDYRGAGAATSGQQRGSAERAAEAVEPKSPRKGSGATEDSGQRTALNGINLQIARGELFALLGPNGGGKTTLFRLLCTLMPLQQGKITIAGLDVRVDVRRVRACLGVVFQSPSVDLKLTVAENLRCHASLYGLGGNNLRQRQTEVLGHLGLSARADERVEMLSGGLRRRVELAKALLHRPQVLLMDEPSTGLDPAARSDLWHYLEILRRKDQTTVVVTTHLLEEADRADRLGILDRGNLVALDTPAALRQEVGDEMITIETDDCAQLCKDIIGRFQLDASVLDQRVRIDRAGKGSLQQLLDVFGPRIEAISVGKPTLEDVFVRVTGHRFWTEAD